MEFTFSCLKGSINVAVTSCNLPMHKVCSSNWFSDGLARPCTCVLSPKPSRSTRNTRCNPQAFFSSRSIMRIRPESSHDGRSLRISATSPLSHTFVPLCIACKRGPRVIDRMISSTHTIFDLTRDSSKHVDLIPCFHVSSRQHTATAAPKSELSGDISSLTVLSLVLAPDLAQSSFKTR